MDLDSLRAQVEEARRAFETAFWRDLRKLKEAVNSRPLPAGELLDEMGANARFLGSCENVMVTCLKAYRHRLLGDYAQAEAHLSIADDAAAACRSARPGRPNPCRLEVLWRRGMVCMSTDRVPEALELVEATLAGYRRLGDPGHNLDGNGIAAMTMARGEIRYELGDFPGAAADFASCVARLPAGSLKWLRARHNLAVQFAFCGSHGAETAVRLLAHQRLAHRKRDMTVEKAITFWLDGSLAFRLRKQRWDEKLSQALDGFAQLSMPKHYWRVASDICQTKYPRRDEIKRFLRKAEPVFLRLVRDDRHRKLFDDLKSLCEGCPEPDTLPALASLLTHIRDLLTQEGAPPPFLPALA